MVEYKEIAKCKEFKKNDTKGKENVLLNQKIVPGTIYLKKI